LKKLYPGLELLTTNILLIDDDKNNIKLAKKQGYKTISLDPEHPSHILEKMLHLS